MIGINTVIRVHRARPRKAKDPRPQKPIKEKIAEYKGGLSEMIAKQRQSFQDVTDSEYWAALCFRTREHKEAFLAAIGVLAEGDKYLDGHAVAAKLGIQLPPVREFRRAKGASQRLTALSGP